MVFPQHHGQSFYAFPCPDPIPSLASGTSKTLQSLQWVKTRLKPISNCLVTILTLVLNAPHFSTRQGFIDTDVTGQIEPEPIVQIIIILILSLLVHLHCLRLLYSTVLELSGCNKTIRLEIQN